jgi:hypothetical protein
LAHHALGQFVDLHVAVCGCEPQLAVDVVLVAQQVALE